MNIELEAKKDLIKDEIKKYEYMISATNSSKVGQKYWEWQDYIIELSKELSVLNR